ncbi:Tetratricopeptide TPR1 [Plasmopara halstedii]|uniref:Tetratricopeptide TPR1 n=1 Tax=Plasmopara halstedii TaxID=4781 RepID=A0A0P1AW97_PLAHL|nr:Tetratricopeptide TPR1 [Plasmopara halstedii]CEG46653.1 Tetratricopeptide TPR1 [Plasmopara halstedii]|eukprot:XP_024583022.1 Tetratricopeptide TPR1 [Plasmopara halstedii]
MPLPLDVNPEAVRPSTHTVPDDGIHVLVTKSPTPVPIPNDSSDGELFETPARSASSIKSDEVRELETQLVKRCQLEDFTPFARCHLWKLMMSFYDRQGVESWAQGIVPHFITSNTFIAKRYINVLSAYIRDALKPGSASPVSTMEPFYIVELGAGSGKFSFYFLRALTQLESVLDFPLDKIRYIMTDFTEQNFIFWKSHPALVPFMKRGIVDFAIFDATTDTELRLHSSGQVIGPAELSNPLCLIANYLFDTLYHDLFQVDRGVLKEGLISVGSKRAEEPDPLDPEIIKRLDNHFKYEQIDEVYYGETRPHCNNILKWYHEYFDPASIGATLLVPIGALSAIERLAALSKNGLVVLSGDKGHSNPDHFSGISDPHIAVHGSFSVMVNYHAIGVYFASRGGFALHSPEEEASLKVSAFVLPANALGENEANDSVMIKLYADGLDKSFSKRSLHFPYLSAAFANEIVSFGPNDFFVMQKTTKEDAKAPSLKAILALMKLSGWDPDVFYKFRDILLDQSPTASAKLKQDVMYGIPLVWKNYYALDKEKDIAFEIGRLFYGLHEYDSALAYYSLSAREMGKHHVTSHNMGLCYYSKKQLKLAATCFEEAYALNNLYQKAATWLQRVNKELGIEGDSISAVSCQTTVQPLTRSTESVANIPLTSQSFLP